MEAMEYLGESPTPPNRNALARSIPSCMMRGRNDDAPGPKVLLHQGQEFLVRPCVEPGGRLVEQPDRPVAGEQPRDRRAAFLPCREIAERQMAETAKADLVERRARGRSRGSPRKRRPEFQIFRYRSAQVFIAFRWPR